MRGSAKVGEEAREAGEMVVEAEEVVEDLKEGRAGPKVTVQVAWLTKE